jgi:hypothetical protein
MHSLINKIKLFVIFIPFIIAKLSFADPGEDFIKYENLDNVQKIINQFYDDKFNIYLVNSSHFQFKDYSIAIRNLFMLYRNDLTKVNACVESSSKSEKIYNDHWVYALLSTAGKDYVIHNMDSIQELIYNINNKNNRYFCIDYEKNVVFSEVQYFSVVKEFFDYYLSYLMTLPDSKQKKHLSSKTLAENIIKSINNPPFQSMMYCGKLGSYLNVIHNVNIKPEIIDFIINQPVFLKPFNFVQAIQDLRKIKSKK